MKRTSEKSSDSLSYSVRGSRRYGGTLAYPAGKCSVAQYIRLPSASELQQLPPLGGMRALRRQINLSGERRAT